MSESSAAGYQLRRHYQKYLLPLECAETGKNLQEVAALAERMKKRKKDKDHHLQHFPGQGLLIFYSNLFRTAANFHRQNVFIHIFFNM